MTYKDEINTMLFSAYNGEISINKFEHWLYNNKLIEETLGSDIYLELLDLDYRKKYALNDLKKIIYFCIDFYAIKRFGFYRVLSSIIKRYLSIELNNNNVVSELAKYINIEDVWEIEDRLLSDCFNALYHSNKQYCQPSIGELISLKDSLDKELVCFDNVVYDKRVDVIEIDVSFIKNVEELHQLLKEKLGFPNFYGMNWNAFWDAITGLVEMPETLILLGWRNVQERLSQDAVIMIELLNSLNEEDEKWGCKIIYK